LSTLFIPILKKITTIPFTEIESIPLLIKDFLQQKVPGFEESIFSTQHIAQQIMRKATTFSQQQRNVLVETLKKQSNDITCSELQLKNIESLRNAGTFTVTTGHQLNLFAGPVFFIYKILQTIKTAALLNDCFPDNKVVPVFWMATEDHDFEEINHFSTENFYYETKAKSGGAVGDIKVQDDFFISEFEREFKDTVFGTELILMMKRAYRKGNSLAFATRSLVHELFSKYGLVVIDGNDAALKVEMKNVFRGELLHHELQESTKETVNFLEKKYGKVQVNPREINLFYLSDTRNRISYDKEQYRIVDTAIVFTATEMLEELDKHPEKFSPNALMRPVYQESVLPNLAYIGGNAEVMYWLELKEYFEKLDLPFPVLIPRDSLVFISEKTLLKTEKIGIEIHDLFRNFASVSKEMVMINNEILQLLDEQEVHLKQQFENLAEQAKKTDKSFANLVSAEERRQLNSFQRMKKRLLRAEKMKQHEKLERLENLFLTVHPGNSWQERVYNFSVFYSLLGREWLRYCYDEMDVEKSELIILSI